MPSSSYQQLLIIITLIISQAASWSIPTPPTCRTFTPKNNNIRRTTTLSMALDYNDPAVAEEFAAVQTLTYEEVADELLESGVPTSPTMTEMDIKLMLVELRMRLSGKMGGGGGGSSSSSKKKRPDTFSNKFEEALWTKPAFEEFYKKLKGKDDHNAVNVVAEFVNDPKNAKLRYYKDYKRVIDDADAALKAPPPVKTPKVNFSGFPANMGEMGLRSTLEAVGTVVEFECEESDDFPVLTGSVTYEDVDTARAAIEQYNGMDMGMGTQLELTSV